MKIWVLLSGLFLIAGAAVSVEQNKAELEAKAKQVLSLGDVDKRKEVGVLYALGDVYLEEGDFVNARRLLGEALRVDSLNFAGQLTYAELLLKDPENSEALETLKTVYMYAEEAALIERAAALLNVQGVTVSTSSWPEPEAVEGPVLYLVAVGERNAVLLQEVAAELTKFVKLEVVILDRAAVDAGSFDRSPAQQYVEHISGNIEKWLEPQDFRRRLRMCGISSLESAPYEAKKVFVWSFLKESLPREEFSEFLETLETYEKKGQYSSDRLFRSLVRHYPLPRPNVRYLGITGYDIFAPDTNFVFGRSGSGYAIMSYHRFRGDFNNSPQNRPRLVHRTVKQAVSSTFFMLDIQRCNSPMCMRAYSNTLDEHDAKSYSLCDWCTLQLDKKLTAIQNQQEDNSTGVRPSVSVPTLSPQNPKHVIVIQGIVQNRETDLIRVKEFFVENGLPADIVRRGDYTLLVTEQLFDFPERPGSSGYEMKQKIKALGLEYRTETGDSTFGDEPFKDAYGILKEKL